LIKSDIEKADVKIASAFEFIDYVSVDVIGADL